jgi:threonine efflux protein
MEYFSAITGMAFIWFLVVMIPGPNFVVVTQASMARSRGLGLWIALGVSMGAGTWASASLLGLSALFTYAEWMYDTIKIIGGCYLVFMGLNILWNAVRHPLSLTDGASFRGSHLAAFQKGLLTSFSNPKTAAFFGSLFVTTFPAQAPFWLYMVTILMVITVSILWYSLIACFFSLQSIQTFYRRVRRFLDGFTGVLLAILGGRLIFGKN